MIPPPPTISAIDCTSADSSFVSLCRRPPPAKCTFFTPSSENGEWIFFFFMTLCPEKFQRRRRRTPASPSISYFDQFGEYLLSLSVSDQVRFRLRCFPLLTTVGEGFLHFCDHNVKMSSELFARGFRPIFFFPPPHSRLSPFKSGGPSSHLTWVPLSHFLSFRIQNVVTVLKRTTNDVFRCFTELYQSHNRILRLLSLVNRSRYGLPSFSY